MPHVDVGTKLYNTENDKGDPINIHLRVLKWDNEKLYTNIFKNLREVLIFLEKYKLAKLTKI